MSVMVRSVVCDGEAQMCDSEKEQMGVSFYRPQL